MTDEKPLHVQVAEALGWESLSQLPPAFPGQDPIWLGQPPPWDIPHIYVSAVDKEERSMTFGSGSVPRYDTDWLSTGPLIERYMIHLQTLSTGEWSAETFKRSGVGATPLLAACTLIIGLAKEGKL